MGTTVQLTQALHRAVAARPDGLATLSGDRRHTFSEFHDRVARFAGALRASGVGAGDMFNGWEHLIALAACPNVAIKLSAFPSMSSEPYPFKDLWPRIRQLIEVFGLERLFWGTDFTRVASLLSYTEGVNYIVESDEFSASEKAMLMGGSVRRYFNWPPKGWVPRSAAKQGAKQA